jgi:hypothetical protein
VLPPFGINGIHNARQRAYRPLRDNVEILFAVLFYVLAEALLQIVGEMLAQGAWRSLANTTRHIGQADPFLALLGCILLGAVLGGLSGLVLPHRIVRAPPLPGLSVLAAPIVTGTLMDLYGRRLRRSGRKPSWLTTFSGGGTFAFVFAIVRLLLVH